MISTLGGASANVDSRRGVQLAEWTEAGPESHPHALRGIGLEDDAARRMARRLAEQGVVEVTELRDGLRVTTASYVGRVTVGRLDISILPKVAWERWLGLFSFALRLRGLVRTEEVAARVSPTSLHDLVILELLVEARDLIGRGLQREYTRHRDDLGTPRGRIDFQKIARQGGIREAAIPCRYTRRSHDFHLNRVLQAGLLLASRLASDARLRGDVRRLTQHLAQSVSDIPLTEEAIGAALKGLDRRTWRYAPSLRLIDLLRRGMLVSMEMPGDSEAIPVRGFALDMNALWQRLLGRVLREWLPNVEVREEYALTDLMTPDPEYSPRRRGRHIPRPDYAVFRRGRLVTFLDAKYRDIWEKGLPREMLYQLALYAAAHHGGSSAILYPTEHAEAAEERIRIHDLLDESVRGTVALRPVNLQRLEALVGAFPGDRLHAERANFASTLLGR